MTGGPHVTVSVSSPSAVIFTAVGAVGIVLGVPEAVFEGSLVLSVARLPFTAITCTVYSVPLERLEMVAS